MTTSIQAGSITSRIAPQAGHLPAMRIARQVNEELQKSNTLVVTAPPGAGKSTLLPLTLLDALPGKGKIMMLEPRRLAAKQIAQRMATLLGEAVGQTVGYRVRFDNKVSAATRIEVVTEGILTRMLVADATLDGIDMVIFDEYHERSIHTDLSMALTRQCQMLIRPELKIVVMSATIDTAAISKALDAPVIHSEGRLFPIDTHYADADIDRRDVAQEAARLVSIAHREHEGDILVFLPGQGEIQRCQELLSDTLTPTAIIPLYGNLPPEVQQKAIAPSKPGERKVVLSTPIAETSLTIEGVRIVVDSGLYRTLVYDPNTSLSHLETQRISLDMARQRAGRAGRVASGTCYRLWTKTSEHLMREQRQPEILEADLAPMLLAIAAFGEADAMALPWMTPPPTSSVRQAQHTLTALGAITPQGQITPLGKRMATMPCHPRIARMIIAAQASGWQGLACDIAAILEEKDVMSDAPDTDINLRIEELRACRRNRRSGRWQRILQIASEYRHIAHARETDADTAAEDTGLLLSYAYPERVATAINDIGHYKLANGTQVQLGHDDSLMAHPWLTVASLYVPQGAMGRVFLAAPLNPSRLDPSMVSERDNVTWDSKQGRVVMQSERRIGRLLIESKALQRAPAEEVAGIVCEAVKKEGLSLLSWTDAVKALQRRIATVSAWHPELQLPDLSTAHLLDTAHQWLPFYLTEGESVVTTASELKKIDLVNVLWALVPYDKQVATDRLAPTHVTVPTGSRIRIDYRMGAEAPVLSVRLQECFGMKQTPCVDDGKRPLLMELLSPGFKPVQLTQDLQSFWQGTYFEVRKELRRRYPKHYWPEDPLQAQAVRGVKRKTT